VSDGFGIYQKSEAGYFRSPAVGEGYGIIVNKRIRILLLYRGTRLIKRYQVGLGNPLNSTPEGSFQILNIEQRGNSLAYPELGDYILDFLYHDGWVTAIHGIYDDYRPNIPIQQKLSGGCVLMQKKDMAELASFVTVGTPVVIISGYETYLNI